MLDNDAFYHLKALQHFKKSFNIIPVYKTYLFIILKQKNEKCETVRGHKNPIKILDGLSEM